MILWRAPALVLAAGLLFAQTPLPQLVTLDVLALDPDNHPVADLRADEIRITDAGQPQKIAYFRPSTPSDTFPQATVVIIDQLNADYNLSAGSWDRIIRALRDYPRPAQLYCYLLTIRGVLFPIHPLPASWLAAELPDASWARELAMPLNSLEDLNGAFPKELANSRGRQNITFNAYEDVAARLARVPGARSIVWVGSQGGPQGPRDRTTPRSTDGEPVEPVRHYFTGDRTGKLADTLADAFGNAQQSYRIAYLPPAANWDGKTHSIHIGATRAGVHIKTRATYTAAKSGDLAFNQESSLPDLLMLAPFDSTVLRLHAGPHEITVDAADVLFLPEGNRFTIRLALQAVRFSDDPPAALSEPRVFTRSFTATEHAAALRDGIRIPAELPPTTRTAWTRVVAADLYTGSFGTLTLSSHK